MGAAGLTSSSVEMADRAGTGLELDLTLVPQREENMTAYEMLLSESQERMLIVAKSGREKELVEIFSKWDLDAVVIGHVVALNAVVATDHQDSGAVSAIAVRVSRVVDHDGIVIDRDAIIDVGHRCAITNGGAVVSVNPPVSVRGRCAANNRCAISGIDAVVCVVVGDAAGNRGGAQQLVSVGQIVGAGGIANS